MYQQNTRRGQTQNIVVKRLSLLLANGGFTLLEMLVVVLIIGILGAIALPQYQRAVLKSRFAALMPIAKSMAESNEVYYLDNGEYAGNAQDLLIQGQRNYPDGTELEFGTTTSHAYVLATREGDFPNNFVVYQKHSEQFPGEIHCEADSTNDMAKEVCKSFGATDDIGEILTEGFTTYVLSGTGHGVAPSENTGSGSGDSGDDSDGGKPALDEETQAKVDAILASTYCTGQYEGYCHDNGDGTVSRCNPGWSTYDTQNNKCLPGSTSYPSYTYATVFNADGTQIQRWCIRADGMSEDQCFAGYDQLYSKHDSNHLLSLKYRMCQQGVAINLDDLTCPDGKYDTSSPYINYDKDETGTETYCTTFGPHGECNPS